MPPESVQFDFPFHFDGRGRTASTGRNDHVRDMLEQLILTNMGERVNRPDFGTGLLQMVFAPNSPELAATLQFTLKAEIQQWLGSVLTVTELTVEAVDSSVTVELVYVLRRSNEHQRATFVRAT